MLSANEVEMLLSELCETQGFCLSAEARERLSAGPPQPPIEFAEAVLRAEGLDPTTTDRQLLRSVAAFVTAWYERRLGVLVDKAFGEVSHLRAAHAGGSVETLTRQVDQLQDDLIAIQRGSAQPRLGMVRWLTDWIPDLNHPLVTTIAAIERLAPPA